MLLSPSRTLTTQGAGGEVTRSTSTWWTLLTRKPPLHRGDMAWIDAMPSQHTFEDIEACVRSYWAGEPHDHKRWEVASASDLVVVERVT